MARKHALIITLLLATTTLVGCSGAGNPNDILNERVAKTQNAVEALRASASAAQPAGSGQAGVSYYLAKTELMNLLSDVRDNSNIDSTERALADCLIALPDQDEASANLIFQAGQDCSR